MSDPGPRTKPQPHAATNQPPPFEDVNLFVSDVALSEAVAREGGGAHGARLSAFGARVGSAEVMRWAAEAHHNPPQLRAFNRYGARIDEVEFHPAYHALMALGLEAGTAAAPWSGVAAGHVLHAALEFLLAEVEPSTCCPITMTYAAPAALRHQPAVAAVWGPQIRRARYDPTSQPAARKRGVTLGMAMTEKQGGSDVRANTTRATPLDKRGPGEIYALTGHKWFCSAPMSDAFVTLAQAEDGLSCFLAPRWRADGERNAIHLMRLKDKIGDRANASAEIEYHGAEAALIGEEGRGVRTILDMVHHTRLDCTLAPAAYMRSALVQALWHTDHRSAFGRRLIEQPLMRRVLADLALESEAATALAFRVVRSFDEAEKNEEAGLFSRLATPVGKYWLNKRVVGAVTEAMECHGGNGYIEEWPVARLYRQAPLNGIWEGSGNVICLDVLRAIERSPESAEVFMAELARAKGANAHLDRAIEDMARCLKSGKTAEADARHLVEALALCLQGALLAQHAPAIVADAFCATRLGREAGLAYGALDAKADAEAIITRALPQL